MEEFLNVFKGDYGLLGVVLAYFMWYNREVLNTYKTSIDKIIEEMKFLRQDVNELKYKSNKE